MELTKSEIEKALQNPANQPRLPAQNLERFDAMKLSSLLDREINRAREAGLSHIGINLDLEDCAALARFLRRGSLMGI